jgi:hypothetical protein
MSLQPQSMTNAYNEIAAHINKHGNPKAWYVGIAKNWQKRLFKEHKVPQQGSWYIVRQCMNDTEARTVENVLIKQLCCGGPCGGNDATVFVYAYLKSATTSP